ncbi:MAG: Crp/Fnr family transcriptional regulator [Raineya sp.]|jgi:CRP-like cAMP-binding protein|nr:Crp/Fnr family transcriptional regulator [Raineya sp.]
MSNKLIEYFSKFTNLSEEEKRVIEESMIVKTFQKDDLIRKEGQYNEDTFFVLEGLVRQYKLINGEEITTNFFLEENWIISLNSFSAESPSQDYLVCVEDTCVIIGNELSAQQIFKKFPRFETISRAIMETVFAEQQTFLTAFLTDTPEQRYLKLLQNKPSLFQRVPQYYIASYLGVKPESLSRIRKRLSEKGL